MKYSEFAKHPHAAFSAHFNLESISQYKFTNAFMNTDAQQTDGLVSSSTDSSQRTSQSQPSKFEQVFYGSNGWDKRGRWIIQKFLKVGKVGIFAGASQSFKTFVLLRISACVANGQSIGSCKVEQSDVHYVAAEGAADIAMRLHALERKHGSVGERISFSHRSVDLRVKEDIAFMKGVLAEHENRTGNKIRLLVIDTLSQSARGLDENNAKEVSHFIGACADFAKQHDLAIILVHHLGKDGKLRGSSAFEGNLDFLWQTERNRASSARSTKMLVKKNKDGLSNIGFLFKLENHNMGICDQWGEAETTLRVLGESFIVDDGEPTIKAAA